MFLHRLLINILSLKHRFKRFFSSDPQNFFLCLHQSTQLVVNAHNRLLDIIYFVFQTVKLRYKEECGRIITLQYKQTFVHINIFSSTVTDRMKSRLLQKLRVLKCKIACSRLLPFEID